ncbi:scaffolding protein [Microbacterium phage Zepp]|nr:scaffolding protein [Microbacterium phage Zepp]
MAPESQEQQANDKVEGQPTGQQQDPTPSSGGNGGQQQAPVTDPAPVVIDKDTKLPDDHPLIVKHGELKAKLSTANSELTEARAQAARTTQLEEELGKRPTTEAVETLQNRYDRLEEFVLAVGLGKALDSRTFTKDLFETDKDIKDLVRDWNRANPSATSQALSSTAGGQQADGKHDPNELIRIAAGKK